MTTKTVIHPLDCDALRKGDVISQEQIEAIQAVRYADGLEAFAFAQMRLAQHIMLERRDLWVRSCGHELRVLTDAELVEYQQRRLEQNARDARTVATMTARVDAAQLTAAQKRRAECLGMMTALQALQASKTTREAQRRLAALDAPAEDAALPAGSSE